MFSKIVQKSNLETMVANKINEGTTINGDIVAQTDIRVDGKILGNITCASKVVIGAAAQIAGNIKCVDLTIEGKVKGNLEVNGVLFFRQNATFEGDVKYMKLVVEEGAKITGSLMNLNVIAKPIQTIQNGQTTANKSQQTV